MDDLMLPPLPKPAMRELDPYVEVDPTPLDWYTADQMREYAKAAVDAALGQRLSEMLAAARASENAACEQIAVSWDDGLDRNTAHLIADAIRARR